MVPATETITPMAMSIMAKNAAAATDVARRAQGTAMPRTRAFRLEKALADVCVSCPVCRRARGRQRGAAFWFVRKAERQVCPFCRAYERVYGRKAHERAP